MRRGKFSRGRPSKEGRLFLRTRNSLLTDEMDFMDLMDVHAVHQVHPVHGCAQSERDTVSREIGAAQKHSIQRAGVLVLAGAAVRRSRCFFSNSAMKSLRWSSVTSMAASWLSAVARSARTFFSLGA